MRKVQLDIDDSIYDNFMGLLEILPKDKLKIISFEELKEEMETLRDNISQEEFRISGLLREHHLMHFKFFDNKPRILYLHESGTSRHMEDFARLIDILKDNDIKYNNIGLDVIMIEKD